MIETAVQSKTNDIQRFGTEARLSRILIHNGIAYISGTLADSAEGAVEEQTQNILSKIDGWLAEAGSDKTRILTATVWLRDIADVPKMNAVWNAWMPEGFAPSRSCVQSTPGRAEFSVEIALQAAVT